MKGLFFKLDMSKYRRSYCCMCVPIFSPIQRFSHLFCATFRTGSYVSSFSPEKEIYIGQQCNRKALTLLFLYLSPTSFLCKPLTYPHTYENSHSSSDQPQVFITANNWLGRMLIIITPEKQEVFPMFSLTVSCKWSNCSTPLLLSATWRIIIQSPAK